METKIIIIVLVFILIVGVNLINSKFKMKEKKNNLFLIISLEQKKLITETFLNTAKNSNNPKKLENYQVEKKKRNIKNVTFRMNKED